MNTISRRALDHLYGRFAPFYEAISWLASQGEWREWGRASLPFVTGQRVLELAHGPGHLYAELCRRGYMTAGIDVSPRMGVLALTRLATSKHALGLIRATALRLPFATATFHTVVATFPTDFIYAADTLNEVMRVVRYDGRLVIVPHAVLRGGVLAAPLNLAYKLTCQTERAEDVVRRRFADAGFALQRHSVATRTSDVTVWVCTPI